MTKLSIFFKLLVLVCMHVFLVMPTQANDLSPYSIAVQKQPKNGLFKKIAYKIAKKRVNKWLSALPMLSDSISPCAKIELTNGEIIDVELAELSSKQISYRPCGETSSAPKSYQLNAVQAIVARNGDVLYGRPTAKLQQNILSQKAIPIDSTGRCGVIVFKNGKTEQVALATWETWGATYRLCDSPEGELKMAKFEEVEAITARKGEVLYQSGARNQGRVSAGGPLLLVILGALLVGIVGVILIGFGVYFSAKRLSKLKKNPNADVGNKKTLKATLILGLILLFIYFFILFPILLSV
jgi:hypothetical protein